MKRRGRNSAVNGQLRQWAPLHGANVEASRFDPDVEIFIVIDCNEKTELNEKGVRVMYPDGFITVHSKRELEIDSWVIA